MVLNNELVNIMFVVIKIKLGIIDDVLEILVI